MDIERHRRNHQSSGRRLVKHIWMFVLDFCCPSDLSRIIIVSIRKRPSAHVAVEKGVASTSLLNLSNAHQPLSMTHCRGQRYIEYVRQQNF